MLRRSIIIALLLIFVHGCGENRDEENDQRRLDDIESQINAPLNTSDLESVPVITPVFQSRVDYPSLEPIYFQHGSVELDDTALDTVFKHVELLEELDSIRILGNPDARILITGHTDYSGSDDVNYLYGLQRADTVRNTYAKFGIPHNMMYLRSLSSISPLDSDNNEINRRVEVDIILVK